MRPGRGVELLHTGLTKAAEADPEATAILDGDRAVSYGELERRSNHVARVLLDEGVASGDRVGMYLEKSAEALIGIYGVLKAGAAYVPLDPAAPASRLSAIARDCGIACLLCGAEQATRSSELGVERQIPLDSRGPVEDESPPPVRIAADDLAYILYTSGSTGRPKGVMHSHASGLAFAGWAARQFGLRAQDRLSGHAPLHFDLSIFDVFAASQAGAAVVLIDRTSAMFPVRLAELIRQARISVWYSVPSALTMLVQRGSLEPRDLPDLRLVLFAGEVFPAKYLRRLRELLPRARMCNLYGPTETNVCTWYELPASAEDVPDPLPIGRPVDGDQVVIRDEQLHVSGATVMTGYWGEPPLAGEYDTGDLAREDGDGNLIFLGRRDDQIKSRGYRIELGDVEAALLAHPKVRECAVLAVPDELVTNRLAAVVAGDDGLAERELAAFAATRVPAYMVPESFSFVDALPRTSTGKVDRQALAAGEPG